MTGAFAAVAVDGSSWVLIDMPLSDHPDDDSHWTGRYDPHRIFKKAYALKQMCPGLRVGIEWPSMMPGEGAQRSRNFGLGLGYVEMALLAARIPYKKLVPEKWKSALGLPGKRVSSWKRDCLAVADAYYPKADLLTPRGRLLDGRLDALLIAHYMRVTCVEGLREMVKKYGAGSPEAMAAIWKGRSKCLKGI